MYSHFAGVVIQTDWPPLRASRSIYRAVSDNTKPVICILMFLVPEDRREQNTRRTSGLPDSEKELKILVPGTCLYH